MILNNSIKFLFALCILSVNGNESKHSAKFLEVLHSWKGCHSEHGFTGRINPSIEISIHHCNSVNISNFECWTACVITEAGIIKHRHYDPEATRSIYATLFDLPKGQERLNQWVADTDQCMMTWHGEGGKWPIVYEDCSAEVGPLTKCIGESMECPGGAPPTGKVAGAGSAKVARKGKGKGAGKGKKPKAKGKKGKKPAAPFHPAEDVLAAEKHAAHEDTQAEKHAEKEVQTAQELAQEEVEEAEKHAEEEFEMQEEKDIEEVAEAEMQAAEEIEEEVDSEEERKMESEEEKMHDWDEIVEQVEENIGSAVVASTEEEKVEDLEMIEGNIEDLEDEEEEEEEEEELEEEGAEAVEESAKEEKTSAKDLKQAAEDLKKAAADFKKAMAASKQAEAEGGAESEGSGGGEIAVGDAAVVDEHPAAGDESGSDEK